MIDRGLERLFPGDGEMARRMRELDWKASPLGDPAGWTQSLRTAVHICLTSRFPIVLWWGRDLRLLYNDAWRPVLGRTKHPAALGAPGREVWPEIWHIIGPMFQSVLDKGEATWSDDQLLPLDRNGYLEEAYFTYSYSPIPDERGGVGGVFAAVSETTLKVIAERRLKTLRELAAQTLQARGAVAAARGAMQTLAANRSDVPFALLYLVDDEGRTRLEQQSPDEVGATDGCWPIGEAIARGEPILLEDLPGRIGRLPSRWETPPRHALVLPLRGAAQAKVLAVLVLGVNPARELDEEHRGFLDMVARHIATSVANASAYEEERRRAEALAELDRAKTTFFSNVSHEFRTPLTLMLGPVEDILAKPADEVLPPNRAALEVVHRNGQRLLRLVNTLLDFARMEAGRAQASFEPTDLGALTADLASNFRSACERAGLRLTVDCPPAGDAYVDREMWEKIVLNLVSNAFKFTLQGGIDVRLRRGGAAFELRVSDTGSGIPESALPRMFERFHRVEGAQGRSHEGSGIGLALVQELVKQHGGTIRVESRLGAGSAFIVSIPAGSEHLPAGRIRAPREAVSTAVRAGAYVDEALGWLPDDAEDKAPAASAGARRVLLADDNADLRAYARRILAEQYEVEAVGDGEAALAAARARRPDLVITDIMMPRLDGFGLIRALRADETLRDVPVVALSARAGEEARVEGLERGADDYLTKPFSARELLVRCEALLRSLRIRREAEARVRAIVETTPECVKLVARDGTLLQMNAAGLGMVGAPSAEAVLGGCIYDVIAPEDRGRFREFNERVCAGERGALEFDIVALDGTRRRMETHAVPLARAEGGYDQLAITRDVTERRRAELALKASEERYRTVLGLMPAAVYTCEAPSGAISYFNEHAAALWGRAPNIGDLDQRFCGSLRLWRSDGSPLRHDATPMALAMREGRTFRNEEVVVERPDGSRVTVLVNIDPLRDAAGKVIGAINVFHDVTERRRQEDRLRESEQQLRLALEAGRMGAWEWDIPGNRVRWSPGLEALHGLAPGTFAGTFEAFRQDIVPEDRALVEQRIAHTLETGEEHRIEYRIAPAGGEIKWVEGRGKLFRDADGRPQRMVGVCADVTERRSAELAREEAATALAHERERLEIALRTGRLGAYEWRIGEEEVWWSPETYALYGVDPASFQPTVESVSALIHPDDRDEVWRRTRECIERREIFMHEYRILPPDGVARWVYNCSRVGLDAAGEPVRITGVAADITERKRAEQSLLARARQQQAVASLGEVALRERDLQKVFERAVAAVAGALDVEYCKVLELLPGGKEVLLRAGVGWKDGLVGRARVSTGMDSQAGYTLASDAPVVVADLRSEARFRGPPLLTEHGVVSGMSCAIRGADGAPWGVLGTHSTRRLEFTKDDVSFLVSVANVLGNAIERARADAALRESDRRKDEFIAMLSHELRNPLAPLRSALEMMRLKEPPGADGQVRAMMERQVRHMVRLVDDLLESSRISRGLLELRREPLDLAAVLRAAVESAEPLIREAGHRLEIDLPREPVWVEGDGVRLAQSFANLLNNAARYTAREGRIWLSATLSDGRVCVSVRDTGAGFSPERREKLFEMFSRGEGSSGLGIGLALARRLVEMHGGRIEALSEGEGRGAEFSVTLPVRPPPADAPAPVAVRSATGCRVLVADDNRDAAESLAALLRALGNDVAIAYDGIEAVEAARSFEPHVVVLDIGMPRLDGYGAARELRKQPRGRRIKIVALTGWGQDEDRRRAQEAGFDAHLVKPAELDALRSVLAEVNQETRH